jgi:2-amino-4-hydroxy-6-hydroxymethyldihydropteridine diphosphokinase
MAFLAEAEAKLSAHPSLTITKSSKIYETEPWPKENNDQHPHEEGGRKWFLNQVVEVETELSPQELAKVCADIEAEVGRTPSHHWGPREIDLDILLYEDQIIDSPELEIPHRHMRDRQFVLVPLVEIAPSLKDPMTGNTFQHILGVVQKADSHKVTPFL